MGNISRIEVKKHEANNQNFVSKTRKTCCSETRSSPVDRVLFLQRTIGNLAVQGLIKSGILQAKLKIGSPGDIYEQEADRVAEQVMKMPEPQAVSSGTPYIQRVCPKCEEEEEKVQAKAASGLNLEADPSIENQIQSLKGGGNPLSEGERAFFEPRFGVDFSQVRVHTESQSAEAARGVNARAFTVGHDVVFGMGEYAPGTSEGKRLLGHELTHVVQQGGGNASVYRQAPPATLAGLTATRVAFKNSGAVDAANCATSLPAALGVDGPATGENGMEMIFRINGAIPPGTEFDVTRTRAAGLWQRDAGVWSRLGGNPAGTNDDHHDQDECLTPVGNRIFVIDTPGLGGSLNPRGVSFLGSGTVAATATDAVWKLSFAEWVIARNRSLGIGWVRISTPLFHRWHSIFSVSLVAGVWTRVDTPSGQHNEIELGSISTAGATP